MVEIGFPFVPKIEDRLSNTARPTTVVVVDDDPIFLDLLDLVFESLKYRLVGCRWGTQAQAIIRAERPDLVILDVHLPDVPPWHVIETLRTDPDTAALPAIVCSASDLRPAPVQRRLRELRCAALPKPFNLADLERLIERTLTEAAQTG